MLVNILPTTNTLVCEPAVLDFHIQMNIKTLRTVFTKSVCTAFSHGGSPVVTHFTSTRTAEFSK